MGSLDAWYPAPKLYPPTLLIRQQKMFWEKNIQHQWVHESTSRIFRICCHLQMPATTLGKMSAFVKFYGLRTKGQRGRILLSVQVDNVPRNITSFTKIGQRHLAKVVFIRQTDRRRKTMMVLTSSNR